MPRARNTPNLVITIPPNPINTTHHKPVEPITTTTTTISVPKSSHCCRPTTRLLLRIFPWVVGCTLVLWIFVLRSDRPPLRVYSPQQHPPVERYKSRPLHPPHRHSKSYVSSSKLTVWDGRAENVRDSFIHAYGGYKQYAALYDVLLPVTRGRANNLNGWGLTLYDSLDTMWIMGLHDIFRESLGTVASASFNSLQIRQPYDTIVHHLGGLLSAYALSKEPSLLTRADDLGKILLPVFNTSSVVSIIPTTPTSEESSMDQNTTSVSWTSILGHQLEFKYLAHLTGRVEYYNLTENFMKKIYDIKTTNATLPNRWNLVTSSGHYDNAQEYLLKQWLLTAKTDTRSLALYLESIDTIIKTQLYISPNRNLLYLSNLSPPPSPSYTPTHYFSHNSCSFPALLALGVHNLGISLPLRDRELHLWAAQGLAYTCWVMYADQGSGLGGEEVKMVFGGVGDMESSAGEGVEGKVSRWIEHVEEWEKTGKKGNGPPGTKEDEVYVTSTAAGDRDYVLLRTGYALNPELIESFYFLWRITKSDRWRNRGWAIFEAIEKHTRTKHGYTSLLNVEQVPPLMKDEMPSYFLGETLKYLYLLFCDDEPLDLNSWVFNSRGHPLPVFDWSNWEKEHFNITLE